MDWLRWHHGTTADPKWRVIARITGVCIGNVVAVWSSMLESASENKTERGSLDGWEAEDIAAMLDMETDQVKAVFVAMQNRVLSDNRLISWDKRNPIREREDDSNERVKRHREHAKEAKRLVTPSNDEKDLDKIRLEEIRKEQREELQERLRLGFVRLWDDYPAKDGRKEAKKHYEASVKTADDLARISRALPNYKQHLALNDWKRPQSGKTWFNNWQDWTDWVEPEIKPNGSQVSLRNNASGPGGANGLIPKPYTPKPRL